VRCTKVRCATATIGRHCRGNPGIPLLTPRPRRKGNLCVNDRVREWNNAEYDVSEAPLTATACGDTGVSPRRRFYEWPG
jgi:hypothetical protein